MRSASGLVLVGALGLGGGAVYLTRGYIESRLLNPQPVAQTRTIVVANQPLSFGAALTGDNLVEIPWPADTDLDGTFTKKEDLLKEGKRVVLTAIQKNEPIWLQRSRTQIRKRRFLSLSTRRCARSLCGSMTYAALPVLLHRMIALTSSLHEAIKRGSPPRFFCRT